MNTGTIKTPSFMSITARIMAEVRNRTCINDVDAEALEKIVQDELLEECRMLDGYYWEEYYKEYSNEL